MTDNNMIEELSGGGGPGMGLTPSNYRGEIIIALKFVPPESQSRHYQTTTTTTTWKSGRKYLMNTAAAGYGGVLLVLVKEAKNLVSSKGIPDPFCKCYLLPEKSKGMKQKTSVCRKTTSPRWEAALSWEDLTQLELSERSLELTVWDHDRIGHNEMLGGVRFNLGTGKYQGRRCLWMDSSGKELNLWQQMLERPNFWVEGSVHLRPAEKIMVSTNSFQQ